MSIITIPSKSHFSSSTSTSTSSSSLSTAPLPSTSDSNCSQCDKDTVTLHSDTGEFICTSCGYVLEHTLIDDLDTYTTAHTGVQLEEDRMNAPLLGVAGNRAVCDKGSVFMCEQKRRQVFVFIDRVTTALEIQSVRKRAKFLFQQSEKVASFNRRFGEAGSVRAAACVYAASLETDKVVPMNIVAGAAGLNAHKLGSVYKQLYHDLHLDRAIFLPRTAFQYVERCVARCEFGTKRPPGCESNTRLIQTATRVLNVVDESGTLIGRNPQCSAAAAVLVAIDALTLQKNMALKNIVATAIECAPTTMVARYHEFRDRLYRSAQTLPWGKLVNMRSLSSHLQCILDQIHERIDMPASDAPSAESDCALLAGEETCSCALCQDAQFQDFGSTDDTPIQSSTPDQPAVLPSSDEDQLVRPEPASPIITVSGDSNNKARSARKSTGAAGSSKKRKMAEDEENRVNGKRRTYTGKLMPPAFERSIVQRSVRLEKIATARRRMREQGEIPATIDHTPPLSPNHISSFTAIDSTSEKLNSPKSLDGEDMLIYELLRYGVPESQFIESTNLHMQYLLSHLQPNSMTARPPSDDLDNVELSDRDLCEAEIAMYMRTLDKSTLNNLRSGKSHHHTTTTHIPPSE